MPPDHDDLCPGIFQLMLELTRRIKRIDIDHRHPGPQRPENRNGILQQVRHHHRHPIADALDDPREVPVVLADKEAFDNALAEVTA